jgi:hypothetical protein
LGKEISGWYNPTATNVLKKKKKKIPYRSNISLIYHLVEHYTASLGVYLIDVDLVGLCEQFEDAAHLRSRYIGRA